MRLLLILTALGCLCPRLPAQRLSLTARVTPGGIALTARPDDTLRTEATQIPAILRNGLRAEISFEVRAYRPRRAFSLLGDHLIFETERVRVAAWDLYAECFTVESTDGKTDCYEEEQSFLTAFLALLDEHIPWPAAAPPDGAYIRVRTRLKPIQIARNLQIITLFRPADTVITKWATLPIEGRP